MNVTDEFGNVKYLEFANKKAARNFIGLNEKFKGCYPMRARIAPEGPKPRKPYFAWVIVYLDCAVMANLEFELGEDSCQSMRKETFKYYSDKFNEGTCL